MAITLLSTQAIFDRNLANLEAAIGQDAPINVKSFVRVLASLEAMNYAELLRFAVERAQQNLTSTAGEDALEALGEEYGVVRVPAVHAQVTIRTAASTGTSVPITAIFTGDSNAEKYRPIAGASESGGYVTLTVIADSSGIVADLAIDDTLTMDPPAITGLDLIWEVTAVVEAGADEEDLEEYRRRVVLAIQTIGGGSNSADYRSWAEAVENVFRAFPYSGAPTGTSYPGDRTVYVEADTSYDADGLADAALKAAVRAAINTDPDTGLARPCLGDTDENLYVESITRSTFNVEIRDLIVDADLETQLKADIATEVDAYLRGIAPYIEGLDSPYAKNDFISDLVLSQVIQSVLVAAGATAAGIGLYQTVGTFIPSYTLSAGETAKLGSVTYV